MTGRCAWCSRPLRDPAGQPRFEIYTKILPSGGPVGNGGRHHEPRTEAQLAFVCLNGCETSL